MAQEGIFFPSNGKRLSKQMAGCFQNLTYDWKEEKKHPGFIPHLLSLKICQHRLWRQCRRHSFKVQTTAADLTKLLILHFTARSRRRMTNPFLLRVGSRRRRCTRVCPTASRPRSWSGRRWRRTRRCERSVKSFAGEFEITSRVKSFLASQLSVSQFLERPV